MADDEGCSAEGWCNPRTDAADWRDIKRQREDESKKLMCLTVWDFNKFGWDMPKDPKHYRLHWIPKGKDPLDAMMLAGRLDDDAEWLAQTLEDS